MQPFFHLFFFDLVDDFISALCLLNINILILYSLVFLETDSLDLFLFHK